MVRWHEEEAEKSKTRQAAVTGGVQGEGEEGGSSRGTAIEESREETGKVPG